MATKSVYDPKTNTTSTQYTPDVQEQVQPVSVNPNTGKTNAQVLAESTAAASKAASMIGTTYTPPTTTPTINSENLGATTTPKIPTPTASAINETFVNSLTAETANNRKALEASYKAEQDRIKAAKVETQAKIDNFTTLQQTGALDNIYTLTQPFRQDLETKQREELYVNENFEANQKLTNELDSLLTQGNELIASKKAEGGLASVAIPNLNKTISDVNARAGVIQAVMSARNGQISQAYTMIDRTVSAINADRQDRIEYFSTLYNFYGDQKTTEQNKLTSLTADEKTYINAQIGLLEKDLERSQETADALKEALTNPETALEYAEAGITLNDSVEQINAKLAKYAPIKENHDLVISLSQKYPSAGITSKDTIESANTKIKSTPEYLQAQANYKKTLSDTGSDFVSSGKIPNEFSGIADSAAGLVASTKAKSTKNNINNALASGNYSQAYAEIANSVEDGLTGTPKTKFADARTDIGIMQSMRDAIQQYADAGGNMGLLTGTEEDIKRKLGIDSGKATALATQLWREFQTYRSNMTGAAFTPQESRDYASVNPTLGKSLDLNLNVIDGALKQLENRVTSTVNARIPAAQGVYEKIGGGSSDTQATQKIIEFGKNNPAYQGVVKNTLNENPDWSQEKVLGYLMSILPTPLLVQLQ